MATAIDERIVAAKFDASDFEKGVNKTIKKLDELKKELNLKDAAKSVKELGEKTEESTKSMSNSLEKLTDRFTNFTGMLKQKLLSGIADEIVGVFFKMTNAVKSFTKSISTDQIGAGLGKYQEILTSVRVMMSAGVPEGTAYEEIEKINNYVKETSYSLTQMTDALSKMTSAGVEVSKATKSVQGIANACADAGVNATDAQRAFYNLSQAYSKGALNYTDYKSLELLNMTTRKFKENLLEAAATEGTLKKIKDDINGVATYQITKKAKGKGGSGKKVNINNLADMMRYDFITNDVMDRIFGGTYYFSDNELLKILQKDLGLDVKSIYDSKITDADREKAQEIAKKRFGEIAVAAYNAAKEARSFTDVMNTFKDYVATGWAKSFELIFGKLETAKEFFTELTQGELAEAIYYISDWRNEVLSVWNESANGKGSGGEAFRQGILNITDAIGGLISMFTDLLPKEDDAAASLYEMTLGFRDTTANIKEAIEGVREWLNSPMFGEKSKTRLDSIKITLSNIGSVLSIVGKVISTVFTSIKTIATAISPIFDGLLIFFENLTSPLSELEKNDKPFDQITHSITDLSTVLKPVSETLGKIIGFLGKVAAFFLQMSISTFTESISFFADILGIIVKIITGHSEELEKGEGTLTQMAEDFEDIKNACSSGLNAVKEFFSSIITDLKKLFGLTDEAENKTEEGGVFSSLKKFFETNEFVQSAKAWVDQAIIDVSNFIKDLPNKVMKFGKNIYDTLWGLFFEEKQVDVIDEKTGRKTGKKESVAILTPLGQWVNTIILKVKNWFAELPQKIINGVGKVTNWVNEVFNYWFAPRDEGRTVFESKNGKWVEKSVLEVSRFDDFIFEVSLAVREWFNDLPNKISKAFSSMGDFLSKIIKIIDEFLFGKKVTHKRKIDTDANGKPIFKMVTERYKTGFSKWLDGVIQEIKKFIKKIPGYIKKGIKGAGDLISTVIGALFGTGENDKDGKQAQKKVQNAVEKPFLGIDITSALEAIKGVGLELFNQVMRIFTGSDNLEENEKAFAEAIASGIDWIRKKAEEVIPKVIEFIGKLPHRIISIFTGEKDEDDKTGAERGTSPVGSAITSFGETIKGFILDLPTIITDGFTTAIEDIGKLWDKLYKALIGEKEDGTDVADPVDGNSKEQSKWDAFVASLSKLITTAFSTLPTIIAQGLQVAVSKMGSVFSSITEWLRGENAKAEMEKAAKEAKDEAQKGAEKAAEGIAEGTEAATENTEKEGNSALFNAILGIGQSLYNMITTTIPAFISEAWKWLGTQAELIWNGLSSIFSSQPDEKEKKASAESIGGTIRRFLREELPSKIKAAWESIKRLGIDIWEGVSSIFTNKMPSTERGQAIANIVEGIKETLLGAINAIGKLFDKEDPLERNLNLLDPAQRAYYSRYADKMKKDSKKANKELDSNNESFVSRLGKSLLEAFRNIGPTILNGLSDAIDWIGKVISIVIDAITGEKPIGDQVEAAYGKEKQGLKDALKRVGESLKKFFLESIPKFIGSAIGALVREAPKWFGQLFEGFSKAEKSEEDKAKQELEGGGAASDFNGKHVANSIMDTILGFFEKIKHFTDTFVNGDIIGVVAIIVAITILLSKMKDIFSLAREAEAAGDIVKWVALTVAFSALASLITTISDLMKSDDIAKSARVDKFMGDLKDLFGLIKEIVTWLSVGKIADAVGEIAEAKGKGKTIELAGEGLGSIFGGFFSNFFSMAGIGAGAYVGGGLLSAAIDTTIGTITEALTSLTSGIDDMITMIEPFTNKLAGINETLTTAIDSVEKIKTLFITFYHVFDDMWNEMDGLKDIDLSTMDEETFALTMAGTRNPDGSVMTSTTNKEAFLKNLSARITLITQLSTFVNQLTDAISEIGDTKDFESKMDYLIGNEGIFAITEQGQDKHSKFTNFLIKLFNSIQDAFSSTKLSRTGMNMTADIFRSTINDYTVILQIASDALSSFGSSLTGLNENNIAGLERSIDFFVRLAKSYEGMGSDPAIVKAFLGNDSLSHIGSQIKIFGQHMEKFFSYIENLAGFKEDQYSETMRKIDGITYLAQQMAKAMTWMEQFGSTSEFLATLGANLESFGGSIGVFFKAIDNSLSADGENKITKERSEAILNAVNSVATIITAIKSLHDMLSYKSQMDINTEFGKIFDAFSGEHGELNSSKLAEMIRAFDEAILTIMNSDNFSDGYVTVGENISRKLFEGIQKAFDEDDSLRPVITPVLNTEGMKEQLRTTFGGNINLEGMSASVSAATTTPSAPGIDYQEIRNIVSEVASEVRILGDKSLTGNDLTKAFEGMAVTIDRNKLVGAIVDAVDVELGKRYGLVLRYNAVPK